VTLHRLIGALLVALLLDGAPLSVLGAEIEDVSFADRREVRGVELVLNDVALLRYRIFIKAYVAALYLGGGVQPEQLLSDMPKRLEIEYFHSIGAAGFAKSTVEGISKNVDAETLELLRPRIERLNALYRDVRPGDRYALTYLPSVGTELALNGRPLGVIEGADFGAAVFAIWFGEAPLSRSLKRSLLGAR
jgi:hypothetical protein